MVGYKSSEGASSEGLQKLLAMFCDYTTVMYSVRKYFVNLARGDGRREGDVRPDPTTLYARNCYADFSKVPVSLR